MNCSSTDCWGDGIIEVDGLESFVRFQQGYVHYRKHGPMLLPIFLMTRDGETELFTHFNCASNAGLRPEDLSADKCYHCGRSFMCEEEGESECCLLILLGNMRGGRFVASHRGAIHWACGHRHWAPELFQEIEGTTITIQEAKNAK